LMKGMTVEEAVHVLRQQDYSLDEAVELVRRKYEVGGVSTSFVMTQLTSSILLLSLWSQWIGVEAVRVILGIPYSTFLVGYNLLLLLYGRALQETSGLERMGISLGLSFTVISVVGLVLDSFSSVSLTHILLVLVSFTEGVSVVNFLVERRRNGD